MAKKKKDTLICEEIERLTELFKNIDKNKKSLIENLISQAAWLSVTIAELEKDINENGTLELFEQGKQSFQRENSNTKTIISLQKNYLSIIKQLLDYLPEDTQNDALDDFLNK